MKKWLSLLALAACLVAGSADAAALCAASPAVHAQSALEWAVSHGANTTLLVSHGWRRSIDKRFARRVLRSETSAGMLAGVSAPLAAKAREIVASCGSVVVSGRRHTRVAGTGHWSLHASGRAVDLRGNPACIYARLRGWHRDPCRYGWQVGRSTIRRHQLGHHGVELTRQAKSQIIGE